MKSRTSFFNRGLSRNLLRRSWPLWAGYALLLLSLLPVQLARVTNYDYETTDQLLQRMTLESGQASIYVSFVMGILAAMIAFGYLYNTRSCGLVNSLPIRRETAFFTVWITGLAPMLAADLLTALLSAALYLSRGLLLQDLLTWLLMTVCTNLAFYGIAVFCAMLTGSLLMLPVIYLALNLAGWAAENCLRALLRAVVYGINTREGTWFLWLSPLVQMVEGVSVNRVDAEFWQVRGLSWMLLYALLGLALTLPALLLYRRRQMECATDTVAFPVLKPVFRYCMALGGALAFASAVYSLLLGGSFFGRSAALLIAALLILGAALGWYVAEMLIRRTVRVFPGKWKGLAVLCVLLCLAVAAAELDLTGFERRVPRAEEVESVTVGTGWEFTIREPENIRRTVELHRELTEHKLRHEPGIRGYGRWIILRYRMKDGGSLTRAYYLNCYRPEDPTDLDNWEELINCPELLAKRDSLTMPVNEKTVYAAQFTYSWADPSGRMIYDALNLSPEEALDFYYNAVLPDRERGSLGRLWLRDDGARLDQCSNVSFYMELSRNEEGLERFDDLNLQICMDSQACLAWLREHTDIPVTALRELEEFSLKA